MKRAVVLFASAMLAATTAPGEGYAFSGIVKKTDGSPVTGGVKVTAQFYSAAEGGSSSGLASEYATASDDGRIDVSVISMADTKRYPYLQWCVWHGADYSEVVEIQPRQHVGKVAYALVAGHAAAVDFGDQLTVTGTAEVKTVEASKKIRVGAFQAPTAGLVLGSSDADKFTFANLEQELSMKPDTAGRLVFWGTNRVERSAHIPYIKDPYPTFDCDMQYTATSDGIATVVLDGVVKQRIENPFYVPMVLAGIEILDPSGAVEKDPRPLYEAFHIAGRFDTGALNHEFGALRPVPWLVPEHAMANSDDSRKSDIKIPLALGETVRVKVQCAVWDDGLHPDIFPLINPDRKTADTFFTRYSVDVRIEFMPFGGAR